MVDPASMPGSRSGKADGSCLGCLGLLGLLAIACWLGWYAAPLLGLREPTGEEFTRLVTHYGPVGNSVDYAIERRSILDPSRWDHVITVHGLQRDGAVAAEIARYLEDTGSSKWRPRPLQDD